MNTIVIPFTWDGLWVNDNDELHVRDVSCTQRAYHIVERAKTGAGDDQVAHDVAQVSGHVLDSHILQSNLPLVCIK